MRSLVTDKVAWSASIVSPAKPIEISFGLWTRVASGNHVLDGGSRSPLRRGNFEREGEARGKVYGLSAASCAKTAKPIEMSFVMQTQVGPRRHVLDGGECTLPPPGEYN